MQPRKKILSYFLLVTYLLMGLHHSVSYSPVLELGKAPLHQHEDFQTVHHEHGFHVGIFHFFGHLFEKINRSDDLADEHLIVFQKTSAKKIVEYNNPGNAYFEGNSLIVFEVNPESLPSPPYHLSLLQKLKRPNTPLRAPPAIV